MASVTSINREKFNDYRYYLNDDPTVPEWIGFGAGVTLTLVLLPFLSSVAFGAISLFALILICHIVGALLGVGLFGMHSDEERLTCFPLDHVPQVSHPVDTSELEKAA